jgi:hypothetical protein
MANLVTNLGTQEGGEVGLETLLQTYDDDNRTIVLNSIISIRFSFTEVNEWQQNYRRIILI